MPCKGLMHLHRWKNQGVTLSPGIAGLRWDPFDDKRYALAWKNPSQDPTRTQRGANRFAIKALPLLPTFPAGNRLETTGFTSHRSNDTYWTRPIWTSSISLDVGRALLALREIQPGSSDCARLGARGIAAIFRSAANVQFIIDIE